MIKQPLKEYLQKLVDYNKNRDTRPNTDPDTLYTNTYSFNQKNDLIKECHYDVIYDRTFEYMKSELFKRYMNDDWIMK